jgi:hypothetical protein
MSRAGRRSCSSYGFTLAGPSPSTASDMSVRLRSGMLIHVTNSPDTVHSRTTQSARQWQLANGQAAVDWMRSSGVAKRMVDDVCHSVETTVRQLVGNDATIARSVLEEYPRVTSCCDQLAFDEWPQALAYLIVHLPDRFCRMFQVLERLLVSGRLPVGKNDGFAAIDIGLDRGLASSPCAASTRRWLTTSRRSRGPGMFRRLAIAQCRLACCRAHAAMAWTGLARRMVAGPSWRMFLSPGFLTR